MSFFGVSRTEDIVGAVTPAGVTPIQFVFHISAALTPGSVAAATTAEGTFAVAGLLPGDVVSVSKPTFQAGLGIAGARVPAANTLNITFVNPTAGAITPTAGTYQISVVR